MASRQRLISWIGHADIMAMAEDLGEEGKKLLDAAKIRGKYGQSPGPLKTALTAKPFEEIHLLSNYPTTVHRPFAKWLGGSPIIHSVELADPTDYDGIFQAANAVLAEIAHGDQNSAKLSILLSPGTPAMAVVWVLLGKSRYPATFYQTNRGDLVEARIPEALFEEVVPELLRDRDIALQHLASESPSEVEGFEDIAGDSRAIRDAVGRAKRAAMRGVSVLLLGESGTGKEMFAQAIHKASPRKTKPMLTINCATLSKTLLESELFGHVKGAYTGALKDRKGAFELVDGGTLFLDEIGECDPENQAKLLRVLQPVSGKSSSIRNLRRLGDDQDRQVDVRIIAATNRDLHKAIRDGRFREDLFYRLAAINITLPALRDRKSDIPAIADRLLQQINRQFKVEEPGYQDKKISTSAKKFVKSHDWPGNVRQLYNVLVQAAVLAEGDHLDRRDLVAALGEMPTNDRSMAGILDRPIGDEFNLEEFLNTIHRNYLRRAMEEAKGVKTQAARLLGMRNYQTLDAQLKRLQVLGDWESEE